MGEAFAMAAPWDSLPPEKTLFVLVTGANSGIGFGICQRLIDEFIASRSLDSHLILIPTARSSKKSEDTVDALRRYAAKTAETSKTLKSRVGPGYEPSETTRRIHLLSIQLDLCNLPSIKKAADQLVNGTLTNPSRDDSFQSLVDVRIPRLDAIVLNAGIGGWSGLDWGRVAHNFLTGGIIQACTFPTFKAGISGLTVNPIPEAADDKTTTTTTSRRLGEVFCANVFGHYLFAHAVLPLLSREESSSTVPPGRIIWESSVEPTWDSFSLSDFQGVETRAAYESSKRLTDVLALTYSLPAVKPYSAGYLSPPSSSSSSTPPAIYLAHPGVVVSTIFPLNAFLFFWYRVAMYLARLLGSPWHTVTAYKGACAMVWLVLAGEEELLAAGRSGSAKWGSSCDRWGRTGVKRTEVEGWGWDGKVADRDALADDEGTGVLRRMVGRRADAADLTEEKRAQFEELGVECWRQMERLRAVWEARMEW